MRIPRLDNLGAGFWAFSITRVVHAEPRLAPIRATPYRRSLNHPEWLPDVSRIAGEPAVYSSRHCCQRRPSELHAALVHLAQELSTTALILLNCLTNVRWFVLLPIAPRRSVWTEGLKGDPGDSGWVHLHLSTSFGGVASVVGYLVEDLSDGISTCPCRRAGRA